MHTAISYYSTYFYILIFAQKLKYKFYMVCYD